MARGRRRRNIDSVEEAVDHLNGGEDARIEQSNSALRAETIRNACRWIANQEAEIKTLREDIAEYKQKHIKGDLGFKMADFNAIYRISKLEVDDRDKLIDTLREGFGALGLGEQSSFLGALDEAAG